MTLFEPIWMQAGGADPDIDYSAVADRALLAGIWRSEGVIRHGASGASALKVSQRAAGANFSVDVAPGYAVIEGDDVSGQGLYMCWSDAIVNVTIPAPPVSGSRTHRIVAQVRDKLHEASWSTYDWSPVLVEDTSGVTPAIPDSAIPLARVTVNAGDVSVVDGVKLPDDRINAMTLLGRPAVVGADADRPKNPVDGEIIRRSDKGCLEIAISGAWYEIVWSTGGPAWSTYTPTWTAVSNPAIGNGTRPGRYTRKGRSVEVSGKIIMGSTTTYGSGQYVVGLPVQAYEADDGQVLNLQMRDVSTGNLYAGHARILTGGLTASCWVQSTNADLNGLSQGGPITLATGDIIRWWGTYEAAS